MLKEFLVCVWCLTGMGEMGGEEGLIALFSCTVFRPLMSLLKKVLLPSFKPISFIWVIPKEISSCWKEQLVVLVLSRTVDFCHSEEPRRPRPRGYLVPPHAVFQGWGRGSLPGQHGRVVLLLFQINCSHHNFWSLCFCASSSPVKLQGRTKRRGGTSKQNMVGRFSVAVLNSGVPVLNHDTVLGWDRDEKHFGSLGSTLCAVSALMRFIALEKRKQLSRALEQIFYSQEHN